MSLNDKLGTRMKEYYENIPKTKLMRRCPVAIRIDGKAFHTFTHGFQKPFDSILVSSMQDTMKYLCSNIQGCVCGFSQSDEITLILIDYKNLETEAWFDYEVQKLCSISASMATMAFNKVFSEKVHNYATQTLNYNSSFNSYLAAAAKGAMFDARCFNIPKEEVANLIYWRQLDAIRNSIQMVAQANYSQKQLMNLSCADLMHKLYTEKNIDWDKDYPPYLKWGSACIYTDHGWIIDEDMPLIKGADRAYINERILYTEV